MRPLGRSLIFVVQPNPNQIPTDPLRYLYRNSFYRIIWSWGSCTAGWIVSWQWMHPTASNNLDLLRPCSQFTRCCFNFSFFCKGCCFNFLLSHFHFVHRKEGTRLKGFHFQELQCHFIQIPPPQISEFEVSGTIYVLVTRLSWRRIRMDSAVVCV